jgi:putative ABC transport system permease protein
MHPILTALGRHKAGVVLIGLQIALTLAIVSNAVFIIAQRIERVNRVTGIEEKDLFLILQAWVNAPADDTAAGLARLGAMQSEDIETLRRLPDVESVAATNTLPLFNASRIDGIRLTPDQARPTVTVNNYMVDEQFLPTMRLKLTAGRAFTNADVVHQSLRDPGQPPVMIAGRAVADKLFPHGDALGKVVYMADRPITIIGIVERLQVPGATRDYEAMAFNSVLLPVRQDGFYAAYAVRAKPGRLDAAMRSVEPALFSVNPMRVFDEDNGSQSFAQIRAKAYSDDYGMAIMMGVVCVVLLGVTAAGIVGLTSFWVGQRRRQIGVRRALGARKVDILRYFQIENLIIAGGGVLAGIALAMTLNMWLVTRYEMERMPTAYVLVGAAIVLCLGQASVFVPARRGSNVPPVVATR